MGFLRSAILHILAAAVRETVEVNVHPWAAQGVQRRRRLRIASTIERAA